ncbi:Uncharacterised protein [Vibrio cholerae]|nr:Uncharacterised protein [Vibrio cholerae]CSB72447.1 Uncharacterised protein [Vibrio cholerae]
MIFLRNTKGGAIGHHADRSLNRNTAKREVFRVERQLGNPIQVTAHGAQALV